MSTKELLDAFLNDHPLSYSEPDERRFVRYAVSAYRAGLEFDTEAFRAKSLSEDCIDYYRDAFRLVAYALDECN